MPVEKIIESVRPEAPVRPLHTEKPTTPEKRPETSIARPLERLREMLRPAATSAPQGIMATAAQGWQKKRAEAIDSILAEGLNDVFLKMNAAQQKAFKKKGEETVAKINELLNHTKVKINKIIKLIRDWLKMIPGINKFFLEQETKIKADKIMRVKDKL